MNKRLRDIRHVALDMDGTIYSGGTLFESTLPFLALLGELGIGHTFLTNNSSKSARDYLARLRQIGIAATPDQLYTSTQATIEHLRRKDAGGATVVRARHGQHEPGVGGGRVCADRRQRHATSRMRCWWGSTRS